MTPERLAQSHEHPAQAGKGENSLQGGIYALKVCVVKSVSIMQAQHNLAKVLRSLGPGPRVAITRNKRVVAELVASSAVAEVEFPDFAARAGVTWGERWKGASSEDLVDESRGEQ